MTGKLEPLIAPAARVAESARYKAEYEPNRNHLRRR